MTPSVVCIQNYQANGFTGEQEEAGEGSGIIMDEDGYIITNEHVVADATSLKVVLYDGRTVDATLVGSDTATDLALIKIEADGLTPATFGDADELSVGDQVVAIGNPGGLVLSSSVTFGYVSALNVPLKPTTATPSTASRQTPQSIRATRACAGQYLRAGRRHQLF